jgi:hypothetical protein
MKKLLNLILLLSMVLLLNFTGKSQNQSVTLAEHGSQQDINYGPTRIPLCLEKLSWDGHTQCIYPASIIPPALNGGKITKISFTLYHQIYEDGTIPGGGKATGTIKLMNTTISNLTNNNMVNDLSTGVSVYEGTMGTVVRENGALKVIFNLTGNFVYEGNNLLLDISYKGEHDMNISTAIFNGIKTTDTLSCGQFSRAPAFSYSFLPTTILEFESTGVCPTPTVSEITDITQTNATVNWTTNSLAPEYNLRYKNKSASEWIYKNHISPSSSNLTGLTSGTIYEVQVQAVCSVTDSSDWSASKDFRIPISVSCDKHQLPYSENFGTDKIIEELCYIHYAEDHVLGGNVEVDHSLKNLKIFWTPTTAAMPPATFYLMLPQMNENVQLLRLRFKAHWEAYKHPEAAGNNLIDLGIVSNELYPATSFSTIKPGLSFDTASKVYNFNLNGYTPSPTGLERIALKLVLQSGAILRIDDIEVSVAGACDNPYAVEVSNIQQNQVTVDWAPDTNHRSFRVQYRASVNGTWPENWQSQNAETHPYILTNLESNTNYQVRVRAVCADDVVSSPSSTIDFTTQSGGGGISKPDLSAVQVYSNQNQVYIVNKQNLMIQKVEIMDIYGRLVYQGMIHDNPAILSMNVATGNYIVRIQTPDSMMNYKVFITK